MIPEVLQEWPAYEDLLDKIHLDVSYNRFFLLIVLFCVSALYLWKFRKNNYPPGPLPLPFLGNLEIFKSKSHIRLTNLKDQYGDIYSIKIGKHNVVVVCSLEGVIDGLLRQGGMLAGRPNFLQFQLLFKGDKQQGISTADLDFKSEIKRTFVTESIDSHCAVPNGIEGKILQETLSLICFFLQEKGGFDPAECFQFAHLHIMLLLVYNETYHPEDTILDEIYESFEARLSAKKGKLYNFFPGLKALYKEHFAQVTQKTNMLVGYQHMILNRHKDTYNPISLRDICDQLLLFIENNEDNGTLDSDDMDFLLLELAEAGFGSVPCLLTWLLGYMAAFPRVQARVHNEIDSVVGPDRFPTLEDQPYLPYTLAVILEVHRVVTIFPFLKPYRAVGNMLFQGYNIPKDTILLFNVWSIHHDNRYWKNPMKFHPERFLDSSGKSLCIPDSYLPFGLGQRRCPGESLVEVEIYMFFTVMMHQLNITTEKKDIILESLYDYILYPKPFQIKITPRSS